MQTTFYTSYIFGVLYLIIQTYPLSFSERRHWPFRLSGLPAAAISCARSVTELLPLAVHTIAVSFRLALCGADMRERLQPGAGNVSWSILVVEAA